MLAAASGPHGDIVATTDRLVMPGRTLGWDEIERATWDGDDDTLLVVEVATASARPVRHRLQITTPGRLVDVVREQVTASVVLTRFVPIDGRRGVRVTGRRTRGGDLVWSAALDAGIDRADPGTRARIDAAVAAVRAEVE